MTAYQQIIHDVQLPAAQVLHPYTVVVQYFKCQLLVFRNITPNGNMVHKNVKMPKATKKYFNMVKGTVSREKLFS